MAPFTPGPWNPTTEEPASDETVIAVVGEYYIVVPDAAASYGTSDADARLIAVAPDLYAVAQLALKVLDAQFRYFQHRKRSDLAISMKLEAELRTAATNALVLASGDGESIAQALLFTED